MEETQYQNRQIAASLLAYSISKIFPTAEINRFGPTKKGFFCDCSFPINIDNLALNLIQEDLQRSILSGIEIESVEMMKENAAGLFQHQGFHVFAEQALQATTNIIELARIGELYAICSGPHPKTTKELGFVKLWLNSQDSIFRIEGVLFSDRKKMKAYLKLISTFRNHEEIGRELNLFSVVEGCLTWHPRGEWIRESLINFWKRSHRELGYEVFSRANREMERPPPFQISSQLSEISENKCFENYEPEGLLFDLKSFTSDSAWALVVEKEVEEKLISYLQFIKRIVKIVPIECRWVFNKGDKKQYKSPYLRDLSSRFFYQSLQKCDLEPKVFSQEKGNPTFLEVRFVDSVGRSWHGPKVELHDCKQYGFEKESVEFVLKGSVFRSLETLIALLVEATGGYLPFWLVPEQVRVLPVKEADEEYAQQIVMKLKSAGLRVFCDNKSLSLSERVYLANKLKVPFLLTVGEYERRSGTVALKCQPESKETRQLSIGEMMELLHQQNEQVC